MEENKTKRAGRKKKEIDGVFANRLSSLLKSKKEQGINQDNVAQSIGVSRQALGKWANGETVPDILDLKSLANYFNVSSDYLLGLSELTEGDITLKKASEHIGISERSLYCLSEIYKKSSNSELLVTALNNIFQSEVLPVIAESCKEISLYTSFDSIFMLSLWNSGGIDSLSLNSCLNDILKSCKDKSLSTIQDQIINFKKRLINYSSVNIIDTLKDLFDKVENKNTENISKLSKEIFGAYMAFNKDNRIAIDNDLTIKETIKLIIQALEDNDIPCEDIKTSYKIVLNATNEIDAIGLLLENFVNDEEVPDDGNNNPEDK